MKKFLLVYSILVILFCFSAKGVLAKSNVTKSEASKIITRHFENSYCEVDISTTGYNPFDSGGFLNKRIKPLEIFKKAGLIDYQVIKSKGFDDTKVKVALTEKGRNTPHIPLKADDKTAINDSKIGFICAKRKIIEIVEIETNDKNNTVLFSFTYEPNEVGIALGNGKLAGKYRGKAKIVFDPFLKTYVLEGLDYWNEGEWFGNNWSYEVEGKKVFTYGDRN